MIRSSSHSSGQSRNVDECVFRLLLYQPKNDDQITPEHIVDAKVKGNSGALGSSMTCMNVMLLRFLNTPFHNLNTTAMRIRFLFPSLFLAAVFMGACASTESVTVEEAPVEEVGPAITILQNQDGVLYLIKI